jgi:hypothetical protein
MFYSPTNDLILSLLLDESWFIWIWGLIYFISFYKAYCVIQFNSWWHIFLTSICVSKIFFKDYDCNMYLKETYHHMKPCIVAIPKGLSSLNYIVIDTEFSPPWQSRSFFSAASTQIALSSFADLVLYWGGSFTFEMIFMLKTHKWNFYKSCKTELHSFAAAEDKNTTKSCLFLFPLSWE